MFHLKRHGLVLDDAPILETMVFFFWIPAGCEISGWFGKGKNEPKT